MLNIKILGIPGSKEVVELKERVDTAMDYLKIESCVTIEGDLKKLIAYNLIGIPALVVDGEVLFQKQVPEATSIVQVVKELKRIE